MRDAELDYTDEGMCTSIVRPCVLEPPASRASSLLVDRLSGRLDHEKFGRRESWDYDQSTHCYEVTARNPSVYVEVDWPTTELVP
jgi:hypothetical protein